MAITTMSGYRSAQKQLIQYTKTATQSTSVSPVHATMFNLAGNPAAGTLAGSSTTAGVVPNATTAGFPAINGFGSGKSGYVTNIEFTGQAACRLVLADMLWKAGPYNFNDSIALSSQPSYSSRLPLTTGAAADYTGTQLWFETVTSFTGSPSIAATYTNQGGTAAQAASASATTAVVGYMKQLTLAAGDCGLQKVESVTATVATVGTFNLLVVRPLWTGRIRYANFGDQHGLEITGAPLIFDSQAAAGASALFMFGVYDGGNTVIHDMLIEVASG